MGNIRIVECMTYPRGFLALVSEMPENEKGKSKKWIYSIYLRPSSISFPCHLVFPALRNGDGHKIISPPWEVE